MKLENKPLSEDLIYWRAERPDEWTMDRFIRKANELENEIEKLNQEIIENREIYCSECGACGESGCCPPDKCKELDKHLKCLYGIEYAKEYKELLDENCKLESEIKTLKMEIK